MGLNNQSPPGGVGNEGWPCKQGSSLRLLVVSRTPGEEERGG
jgi:hypothetical protein